MKLEDGCFMDEENAHVVINPNENEEPDEEDEKKQPAKEKIPEQAIEEREQPAHDTIEQPTQETIQLIKQIVHEKEKPKESIPPKIAVKQVEIRQKEKPKKIKKDILKVNDVVRQYVVICKLAEGGYGQIYKAVDPKTKIEIALKIELITPRSDETESVVLKRVQGQAHCPKLYECGVSSSYMFVVMQLMGKNLSELRKSCPLVPSRLSLSSAFRATFQCLKGIEELHSTGFIHRDIKPSNFAIGKEMQESYIVYLLDYGLCREFVAANGIVKPSRQIVGFRGTVRYASVNAHARKDLGRRDDLWSLFYSFIELLTGSIPWRTTNNKEAVLKMKTEFSPKVLYSNLPPQVKLLFDEIEKLNFSDKPNYDTMYRVIERYLKQVNVNMADSYDWHLLDCRGLTHWSHTKSVPVLPT